MTPFMKMFMKIDWKIFQSKWMLRLRCELEAKSPGSRGGPFTCNWSRKHRFQIVCLWQFSIYEPIYDSFSYFICLAETQSVSIHLRIVCHERSRNMKYIFNVTRALRCMTSLRQFTSIYMRGNKHTAQAWTDWAHHIGIQHRKANIALSKLCCFSIPLAKSTTCRTFANREIHKRLHDRAETESSGKIARHID